MKLRLYFALLLTGTLSFTSLQGQSNQDQSLLLDNYMTIVRTYHPMARQAELLPDQARARIRQAWGNFDPEFNGTFDNKFYDEKTYWKNFDTELSIPTPIGIEFKASYYNYEGQFLNTDQTIPAAGQAGFGVKVPLLQGLFMDERRTALRQARVFREMTEVEQVLMINELLFDAVKAYIGWSATFFRRELVRERLQAALIRFDGIKGTFEAGDAAAIDTVEAATQYQQLQVQLREAQLDYIKASLKLSNFIWTDEGESLYLAPEIEPEDVFQLTLPFALNSDSIQAGLDRLTSHPMIQEKDLKLESLRVDRRMQVEKLKPKLSVNYQMFTPPDAFQESVVSSDWINTENYKWGVELSFPLLFRSERGKLQETEVKLKQTSFERDQKLLEIENKILSSFQDVNTQLSQLTQYLSIISQYRQLLEGEQIKFDAGESSLFLINSREMKLLEAEQKQVELREKYLKAQSSLLYNFALFR